jgi:hypothetical protein
LISNFRDFSRGATLLPGGACVKRVRRRAARSDGADGMPDQLIIARSHLGGIIETDRPDYDFNRRNRPLLRRIE